MCTVNLYLRTLFQLICFTLHAVADQFSFNEQYAERHQVAVTERELIRIEEGCVKSLWCSPPFPPPYWAWELPPAFRKHVVVSIYVYIFMYHFHTSDQRVKPVHISYIALVLEC